MENAPLTVSDFVALLNQTLEYAYPSVAVVGEVSEFRVSQGKWVSFKLKDGESVVDCFMGIYQLRIPLEDGMKVMVIAAPRVNAKWGKFSLNVRTVKPIGEGSIKKGFELLKAKFEAEGLFAPERKRALPRVPSFVGVVTSTESAAYADFCKIMNERWGGMNVEVAHTQVQGEPAADQMIRAIKYFNTLDVLPDVLVIIADFFNHVDGFDWVIVSGQYGEKLVVIFRCDGYRKNAGKLAKTIFGQFGSAGGHKEAARAEVPLKNLPLKEGTEFSTATLIRLATRHEK